MDGCIVEEFGAMLEALYLSTTSTNLRDDTWPQMPICVRLKYA
jgi:hypothetical protein